MGHHHEHNHHHHTSHQQRVYKGKRTIVFSFNNFEKTFEKGTYHPSHTDNRAPQEHANKVLSEVEAIINNSEVCITCIISFSLHWFFVYLE